MSDLVTGVSDEAIVELAKSQNGGDVNPAKLDQIETFIESVSSSDRLAIITSGGTSVPIERRTVRVIDNFSTGIRGARLAEFFITEPQYKVLFLYRSGSSFPFLHRMLDLNNPLATLSNLEVSKGQEIETASKLTPDRFAVVPFHHVFEYILLLRHACISSFKAQISRRCFICLAAAVSDFYVPIETMPLNKIQSREVSLDSNGDVSLKLKSVPKSLELVKKRWNPDAFVLAFKLETDELELIKKSVQSLEINKVNAVLANDLLKRYREVHLVMDLGKSVRTLSLSSDSQELDRSLIGPALLDIHNSYIHDRRGTLDPHRQF